MTPQASYQETMLVFFFFRNLLTKFTFMIQKICTKKFDPPLRVFFFFRKFIHFTDARRPLQTDRRTKTDGCGLPNDIIWYEKDGRGESKTVKNGCSVQRILVQICYGRTGAPIDLLDVKNFMFCVSI